MTSQLTPERTDVLPKDFDKTANERLWLQPWFWLAILGVVGMVALPPRVSPRQFSTPLWRETACPTGRADRSESTLDVESPDRQRAARRVATRIAAAGMPTTPSASRC